MGAVNQVQFAQTITRQGEPIPDFPGDDATKDEPLLWAAEIRRIIEQIKQERAAEAEEA